MMTSTKRVAVNDFCRNDRNMNRVIVRTRTNKTNNSKKSSSESSFRSKTDLRRCSASSESSSTMQKTIDMNEVRDFDPIAISFFCFLSFFRSFVRL